MTPILSLGLVEDPSATSSQQEIIHPHAEEVQTKDTQSSVSNTDAANHQSTQEWLGRKVEPSENVEPTKLPSISTFTSMSDSGIGGTNVLLKIIYHVLFLQQHIQTT